MSIVVHRYKDGKVVPVKVSIWDALKGVPPPKARAHKVCNLLTSVDHDDNCRLRLTQVFPHRVCYYIGQHADSSIVQLLRHCPQTSMQGQRGIKQ